MSICFDYLVVKESFAMILVPELLIWRGRARFMGFRSSSGAIGEPLVRGPGME